MPPYKRIKTYKNNKLPTTLSLPSIRIRKGRSNRLNINESIEHTTRTHRNEISLKNDTENTFDKLVNAQNYNKIKITDVLIRNISTSDSDLSKNKLTTNHISIEIHSPIMTRSKSKIQLTDIEQQSKQQSINGDQSIYNRFTSPIDISLSIEKETNNITYSSLSYIKIPRLEQSKNSPYSNNAKLKQQIISSTPYNIEDTKLLSSNVSSIINGITPKLNRKTRRCHLHDAIDGHNNNSQQLDKQNHSPKVLLDDSFKGFNDDESQESLNKSKQFKDFINLEIQQQHSLIVLLDDCFKGFNDDETQESLNQSNQYKDVINLEIQQCTIRKQNRSLRVLLDGCFIGFNDKEIQESLNKSIEFKHIIHLETEEINNRENSDTKSAIISTLILSDSDISLNDIEDDQQYCCSPSSTQLSSHKYSFNNQTHDDFPIIESSIIYDGDDRRITKRKKNDIKPGKSYRRSLVLIKQSFVQNTIGKHDSPGKLQRNRRLTLRNSQIVPININKRQTFLGNYANLSYVQEKDQHEQESNDSINTLENSFETFTLTTEPELILKQQQQQQIENCITAKEIVLRKCNQTEPNTFEECYPNSVLNNCHKIGEGVYGEVFLYKRPSGISSVIKIIPIEGDLIVNGERQKTFDEVLSEIVISLELSNLRNNNVNQTTTFVEVHKINCVIGHYPDKLIDLWHLYDETKGSENDAPEIFPNNQIYIVLELINGGQDAESFVFNNASQALSMFKQVTCALAVAENQLNFEHRDLHWGNILIKKVDTRRKINFLLNGNLIEINSCGIEATIIDYTLSRAQFEGVVVFNDLSQDDDLFKGTGDHQFDIYRLMQQANRNNWQDFQPQSNILWLQYLLKKMMNGLRYLNIKTKVHRENIKKIKELEGEILSFDNVIDFVKQKFVKKSKIC